MENDTLLKRLLIIGLDVGFVSMAELVGAVVDIAMDSAEILLDRFDVVKVFTVGSKSDKDVDVESAALRLVSGSAPSLDEAILVVVETDAAIELEMVSFWSLVAGVEAGACWNEETDENVGLDAVFI